jgi:hypothetical protein
VDKRSPWVELFDLTAGRSIDSRGCEDLDEALQPKIFEHEAELAQLVANDARDADPRRALQAPPGAPRY